MGGYQATCTNEDEIVRLCREINESAAAVTRCKTATTNAEHRLKLARERIDAFNKAENQRVAEGRCACAPVCDTCGKVK